MQLTVLLYHRMPEKSSIPACCGRKKKKKHRIYLKANTVLLARKEGIELAILPLLLLPVLIQSPKVLETLGFRKLNKTDVLCDLMLYGKRWIFEGV